MMPVTTAAVFVASARSPVYWLPIGAKRLIREAQTLRWKGMPRQEDMSQKVVGSTLHAGKGLHREIFFPVYLCDHIALASVHSNSKSCLMF